MNWGVMMNCWIMICEFLMITTMVPGVISNSHSVKKRQVAMHAQSSTESISCTSISKHEKVAGYHPIRTRRSTNVTPREDIPNMGKAVYFTGSPRNVLQLNTDDPRLVIPSGAFTIELWVKVEGGQEPNASIISLMNRCSRHSFKGWNLHIASSAKESDRDAMFTFTMSTDFSRNTATLSSTYRYQPNVWAHIAATYDKDKVVLYINGAKMASRPGQKGNLFSPTLEDECIVMQVGGTDKEGSYVRGYVANIRFWKVQRSHSDIKDSLYKDIDLDTEENLLFFERFADRENWKRESELDIELFDTKDIHNEPLVQIIPPSCGATICDSPDLIKSYIENPELQQLKTLQYRIINIMDDDGQNGKITSKQIKQQHAELLEAYTPYNISWEFTELAVKNTTLRQKTILFGCDPSKIGNGICNLECKHDKTGNDGGDCDEETMSCPENKFGDRKCDFECNRVYNDWDDGDCCRPNDSGTPENCFDPFSTHRVYLTLNDFKSILGFTNEEQVNVYFAEWTVDELLGVATFPWDKSVFSSHGGVVLKADNFGVPGKMKSLVHEMGHVLGLWHTHHGVSEMDCSDGCLEVEASMERGDMCSDTNPTPENSKCRDPDKFDEEATCGLDEFRETPFKNYMGYGGDTCTDHFTEQQVARMHCHIDLMYQQWEDAKDPRPVPMKPKVLHSVSEQVTIGWIAPLGLGSTSADKLCADCSSNDVLRQYASAAYSPIATKLNGFWSPDQAVGEPDASSCIASTEAWLPDMSGRDCDSGCYITFDFKHPAVPNTISLWVNWNSYNGIRDVELIFKDSTTQSLGSFSVYCDMPLTIPLRVNKMVTKVKVYVRDPFVSIDAVQMESQQGHSKCQSCQKPEYKVTRTPGFEDGKDRNTNQLTFTDDVEDANTYQYRVTVIYGGKTSIPSPVLNYKHGEGYCGDGVIKGNEQCDDGNMVEGDGCSLLCKIEEFFQCSGSPSLCYRHDGDGVCEGFERIYSIKDCGFHTPEHFEDQWAIGAITDKEFVTPDCPIDVVVGPPPISQECRPEVDPLASWHPCGSYYEEDDYWIEVAFANSVVATSVILYLGSDGMQDFSREPKSISVELIDTTNKTHSVGEKSTVLSCRNNPLHVNVMHDLSKPFYHTKGVRVNFQSSYIAVSAIALRSSTLLDPITIHTCLDTEVYNPKSQRCMPYMCEVPKCDEFMIKLGSVSCSGASEGDICAVTCDRGYKLKDHHDKVRCIDGSWKGDVQCKPVDCGSPVVPYALSDCPDGTTLGKVCKFHCKNPAKQRGVGTNMVCEEDGTWSVPEAYCEVLCKGPPKVNNATLNSQSCEIESQSVGTRCKFRCDKGFHIVGQPGKKRMFKRVCSDDGTWAGPVCEKIACPKIDPIYYGLYSCSKERNSGSECTLKCPGPNGPTSTITCLATGEWSEEFTKCKFAHDECADPPEDTGLLIWCPEKDIGSSCGIMCDNPSQDPFMLKSKSSKQFTRHQYEFVLDITCTGSLSWYPEPSKLVCIERCSTDFIGDGFCDENNNREFCEWDGGDCCDSTAQGGIAQPYSNTCAEGCDCKDPNAEENTGGSRHRRHHRRNNNLRNYMRRAYQRRKLPQHRQWGY